MKGIERNDYKLLEIGRCKECGGRLRDPGLGFYICSRCGREQVSEFGRIKEFIRSHGAPNAIQISEGTGIPISRIEKYLREGRIEIPENSEIFIPCLNCGADIRYGKYCPACAPQLSKKLQGALIIEASEIGEVPKKRRSAKMSFLDK